MRGPMRSDSPRANQGASGAPRTRNGSKSYRKRVSSNPRASPPSRLAALENPGSTRTSRGPRPSCSRMRCDASGPTAPGGSSFRLKRPPIERRRFGGSRARKKKRREENASKNSFAIRPRIDRSRRFDPACERNDSALLRATAGRVSEILLLGNKLAVLRDFFPDEAVDVVGRHEHLSIQRELDRVNAREAFECVGRCGEFSKVLGPAEEVQPARILRLVDQDRVSDRSFQLWEGHGPTDHEVVHEDARVRREAESRHDEDRLSADQIREMPPDRLRTQPSRGTELFD